MSEIFNIYKQSELALAAYTELNIGEPSVENLKKAGLSQSQAAAFAANWHVIDQYDGMVEKTYIDEFGVEHSFLNPTGLSVTLFEDNQGHQTVAIRGTNGELLDLATDVIDIALLGTTENQAQYAALSAKAGRWRSAFGGEWGDIICIDVS